MAYPVLGTGVLVKDLETADEPELVFEDTAIRSLYAWSRDGTMMVLSRQTAGGAFELVALRLHDRTTTTLFSGARGEFGARLSPDGRWLAFASAESSRSEIYVTDYPAARVRRPVSTDGGFAPMWAPGGGELFLMSGTSMMVAKVRNVADMTFDRPVRLFDGLEGGRGGSPWC